MKKYNSTTKLSFINNLNSILISWGFILFGWFIVLCIVSGPRSLDTLTWAINFIRSMIGVSEPGARALTTITLCGAGMWLKGILLSFSFRGVISLITVPLVLVLALLLAVAAQWINYGYFPIVQQLRFGLVSAVLGPGRFGV